MIEYILFLLRLGLLFLSFLGYASLIKDRLRINPVFLPSVVVSLITLIVYIGGTLGILLLTVRIVAIIGIIQGIYYILKGMNKRFELKFLISPSVLFFIVTALYFVILLKGSSYLHYDNFSHWGTIVKEMFYFNSFPDSRTIISAFRNYPPGTASFIYYVCKIIGYSESHALMAQAMMISAFLSVLFCNVDFERPFTCFNLFFTSVISLCVLSYDDTTLNVYNLLVDALLGFIVVAGILCIYNYKNDIKRLFFTLTPILSMLVITKDSGSLFFIMLIIYLIYELSKERNKGKGLYLSFTIILPLIINIIWKIYVVRAYPGYDSSSEKFSVSANTLSEAVSMANGRDQTFIRELPMQILREVFNLRYINTQLFIIVNLISILCIIFLYLKDKDIKLILKSFILTNIMTGLYLISLYVLYAMIMNESEAITLSAFDRYYSTMIIILVTIQLFSVVMSFSEDSNFNVNIGMAISSLLIFTLFTIEKSNTVQLFMKPDESKFRRYNIQKACEDARNYIGRGQKIFLYNGEKGSQGYCYYLMTYEMLTTYCEIINDNDFKGFPEKTLSKMENCDYVIIAEDREGFLNNISIYNNINIDNGNGNIYKLNIENDAIDLVRLDK